MQYLIVHMFLSYVYAQEIYMHGRVSLERSSDQEIIQEMGLA